jgi:hypothetical protein
LNERVYKGVNGDLVLTDDAAVIKRGAKGFLHDLASRGEKVIPYGAITGVQFQGASLITGRGGTGYLRIVVGADSWSPRRGRRKAWRDENTVLWNRRSKNDEFAQARDEILRRIGQREARR